MAATEAFVTLATNDSYSLGALVLGHSLRNVGTARALVVLITPGVTQAMKTQLSKVYDVVSVVDVLDSQDAANLALLSRPELGVTLTKLHAWNLTEYKKAVFLDADALVLQNVDELFDREELSAAPDVGWPDCFNTGVFVFRPSTQTFQALLEHAIQKGSFDGGDQGLLNAYFSEWATKDIRKHLPFIYNMVATVVYSYAPAFKEFGQNVKIVHFLGSTKPWHQPSGSSTGSSPVLANFLEMWWNIFNSNVRGQLEGNLAGLAGNFSRMDLGSGSEERFGQLPPRQTQRSDWEAGRIDYLGEDRYDNIQDAISRSIGGGLTQERSLPQTQTQTRQPSPPQTQSQQPSGQSGQQSQSVRVESHAAGAVAGGAAAVQGLASAAQSQQHRSDIQTQAQQPGPTTQTQQQTGQHTHQPSAQQTQQGRQPSPPTQTGQSSQAISGTHHNESEQQAVAGERESHRLHQVHSGSSAQESQAEAAQQTQGRRVSPPAQSSGHLQTVQSQQQQQPAQGQQGQQQGTRQISPLAQHPGQSQGKQSHQQQQHVQGQQTGHQQEHQQQQGHQAGRQVSPPVSQQSSGQHTQQPQGQQMGRQATPPFQGGQSGQGQPAQQYQPGQQYQQQGHSTSAFHQQGPNPQQFQQQQFPSAEFHQHVLQQQGGRSMQPGEAGGQFRPSPQGQPNVGDEFYSGDPRRSEAGPGQPRHPQQGPGGPHGNQQYGPR